MDKDQFMRKQAYAMADYENMQEIEYYEFEGKTSLPLFVNWAMYICIFVLSCVKIPFYNIFVRKYIKFCNVFPAHILFDDAFEEKDGEAVPNSFVRLFASLMNEAAR